MILIPQPELVLGLWYQEMELFGAMTEQVLDEWS